MAVLTDSIIGKLMQKITALGQMRNLYARRFYVSKNILLTWEKISRNLISAVFEGRVNLCSSVSLVRNDRLCSDHTKY